jgi:hypothetical protein
VSQWVIDKTTLQVQSGHDLIQHVFVAADGFSVDHSAANGNGITFSRFCSADLADASAFYNAASGLGYNEGRLFLDGEESGVEGRPMAHIASGPDAGKSYELAALGNMAYENLLANPHTGDKTVVAVTDDGQNGQVYFYYGDKHRPAAPSTRPVSLAAICSASRSPTSPLSATMRRTPRPRWVPTSNPRSPWSISAM